ncbi:MAG: ABC transporter substrate-binding protein [Alphaproteobacteria bacterium]|nr:ABC transporter substrate-binding protein [Alphaproteobacteria bacterium]
MRTAGATRRTALATLGAAAWGAAMPGTWHRAGAQPALTPVTAITPFGFISDFAELMNAHSGGHFRAAGLDSKVLGGQGTGQAVTQLIAGQAKFTRASGLDIARAVYAANAPLLVVATLYQGSNWYVISHKDKPIRTAEDLRGKRMGVVSINGTTENFLDLMLGAVGASPGETKREAVGNSPAAFQFVKQGRIDGFIAAFSVAIALKEAGEPFEAFNSDKYAPMPSQVYATTREVAEKEPELVVRFLRGLKASVDDLLKLDFNVILDRISKDFEVPGIRNRAPLVAIAGASKELWFTEGRENLLRNVPALWDKGATAINRSGLFKVDDITKLYTNRFIDEALRT